MADIFNTQGNKATQAVIDAASKILMGVNDEETAKAQTEEEHPAIDPKNQELEEAKKKAKMDAVGDEDGDIDNDGDEDDSDAFLAKKRKAIKKAMAKEGVELPDYVIEAIEEVLAEDEDFVIESEDLDASAASKALTHDCAKHVVHNEHGEGQCVPGMHTLEEDENNPGHGYVTHYDVMFDDGIVEDVPVEELEIVSEMSHGHPKKKKKK
jgi:hypothetical protein|tara:strand:+ start:146 stop:775 length:630 start_codon:yes stop_codon:yes gene_type:complete